MMYNDVCNGKMMIDQWMNYGDLIVGTPPKHEIIYIIYICNEWRFSIPGIERWFLNPGFSFLWRNKGFAPAMPGCAFACLKQKTREPWIGASQNQPRLENTTNH